MAASTPPKKPRRPKLKLDDMRAQAFEAHGTQEGVDAELEDGSTVFIPAQLMLSDDQAAELERIQRDEDLDHESWIDANGNKSTRVKIPATIGGEPAPSAAWRIAHATLGTEEHERLIKGGGHSNDVLLAWRLTSAANADPTPQR